MQTKLEEAILSVHVNDFGRNVHYSYLWRNTDGSLKFSQNLERVGAQAKNHTYLDDYICLVV